MEATEVKGFDLGMRGGRDRTPSKSKGKNGHGHRQGQATMDGYKISAPNLNQYKVDHELCEMEIKVRLEMTEDQLELLRRRMESKEEQWNGEKRAWDREKIDLMSRIVDLEDAETRLNDYRRKSDKLEGELSVWKEKELKLRRNEVNDLLLGIQKDSEWKKKCEELESVNFILKENLRSADSEYSQMKIKRDEYELTMQEYQIKLKDLEAEKLVLKNKLNDEFNLLQKRFAKEVTEKKRELDGMFILKESLRKELENHHADSLLHADRGSELQKRCDSLTRQITEIETRNTELANKMMSESRKVMELES
jgi:hypothetical protein